jgi:transposase
MSPRADHFRVRYAVLLASAEGLRAASEQVGVSSSRISEWRKRLEAETGEHFPRRHDLKGKLRPAALTERQRCEIRALRAEGTSWKKLARAYRVSVTTCRRATGDCR